jgi:DNA-directed RNA polymerase subunit RPC12/RpoP
LSTIEQVKCPHCGHRLFDLKSQEVELDIKCPNCRKVVSVIKERQLINLK